MLERHDRKDRDAFQQFLDQKALLETVNELEFDLSEVEPSHRPILVSQKEDADTS